MIILDREAGTKDDNYEGLTLRHPSAAFTRTSSLLLPDYNTSEALHWKSISPTPPKRPRIDPRIWKAALYAFALYVFLSLVIVLPITVIKSRKKYDDRYQNIDQLWNDIENANPPTLLLLSTTSGSDSYNFAKNCNRWSNTPSKNSAQATFSLPPNGPIAIRSNATYTPSKHLPISGSLVVGLNNNAAEKSVVFNLSLSYSSSGLFKQTYVCFSSMGPNRGLSIYVPNQFAVDDQLEYDISVLLPQVKSAMDSFLTYLPMINQTFGALGEYSTFNMITLEGAARPIVSTFLEAQKISVKNLAAPIVGAFNVTTSLSLDAVEGPVISNITLTQVASPNRPTLLDIDTGDSEINTNIVLDSSQLAVPPRSPAFGIQVKNINKPLTMNIMYSQNTPNTTMQLRTQNDLGATTINIDPRYEGCFSAKSKIGQVTVLDSRSHLADPTGARQPSMLTYDQKLNSFVSGWIGWGARPMRNTQSSTIYAASALSPVFLTFGSE